MKEKIFRSILLMVFIATGFVSAQDYVVGEGDVLTIEVYENEDLNTTVRVSGDEMIVVPLIGQVNVHGLSVSKIADKIRAEFADGYLVDPHVSIFVTEFRSKKATILGQVASPGLYDLREHMTLLELISKAGGLKDSAGRHALIKRRISTSTARLDVIRIDLKQLLEEGDTSLNIGVRDGDNIYISKVDLFYINGEVKKPDAYKYDPGTTLIKAITMAGGFTGKASVKKIKIVRKVNGKEIIYERVKINEKILPDDIIVVPESFF